MRISADLNNQPPEEIPECSNEQRNDSITANKTRKADGRKSCLAVCISVLPIVS